MVTDIPALLRAAGAVEYGSFVLASGAKSDYYLDIKTAVTDPVLLRKIGEEIARKEIFDTVAGIAVGGIAIAVAASFASDKPYAIIRSSDKAHGKSGRLIGRVEGKRVLLVEDVTTSGGSALYGIEVLRSCGAIVDTVVTVVDRQAGAFERLGAAGIRLVSLATTEQILKR